MSSTEVTPAGTLSCALYDEVIAPLGQARKAAGQQAYFPLARQPGAKSYYDEPILRVMQPSDFPFPGTADEVVDALAALWTAEGETELAAMAPRLKQIAEALREEAMQSDGSVSILCYTMF